MERLKEIKSCLVSLVQTQLGDIEHTDAKEMGEVIDMIKDLEEAMYYCAIVEAMEKSEKEGTEDMRVRSRMGYKEMFPHGEYDWDDMSWRPYYFYQDSGRGNANQYGGSGSRSTGSRMGYGEGSVMSGSSQGGSSGTGSTSYYGGPNYYYSEGHEGSKGDIKEVNKYLSELSDELPHMIEKSTPEEKKMLSEKLQQVSNKIK